MSFYLKLIFSVIIFWGEGSKKGNRRLIVGDRYRKGGFVIGIWEWNLDLDEICGIFLVVFFFVLSVFVSYSFDLVFVEV